MLNTIKIMFEDYIENFNFNRYQINGCKRIIIDCEISITEIDDEIIEFWRNGFMISYNKYNKAIQINANDINYHNEVEYDLDYLIKDLLKTYHKNKDNIRKELIKLLEIQQKNCEGSAKLIKNLLLNLKQIGKQ